MPNQRKREKRAVRQVRHRAAFHADRRYKAGGDPEREFKAVQDLLLAAATRAGARDVDRVTQVVADHARQISDRAGMRSASRGHNESVLAGASFPRGRLGVALRWLRTAISLLPDDERDGALAGYAAELHDDARSLERR